MSTVLTTFWRLDVTGTAQTSDDPRVLGVLNLLVRRQLVYRDVGGRTTAYDGPAEESSVVLPPAFLRLPMDSNAFIKDVLAGVGVDRRNQSSFATRIFGSASALSRRYPRGFRMTATLHLTAEISEGEDLEQLVSESDRVMRGASKSAILGLKDKVYDAEDRACCSICLEDFHGAEKVTELPCSHLFHRPCIVRWLEERNSCPLCRCELDT